jgi:DnaJ-class molecular chaperone
MEMKISLKEALLGFTKTVVHLDGHEVKLTANKVTKPMEIQKIKGEGMPFHNFPSQFGCVHFSCPSATLPRIHACACGPCM